MSAVEPVSTPVIEHRIEGAAGDRPSVAPMYAVMVAAAALRFWRLGANSLWTDEGSTWTSATAPLARLIELCATKDASPPLFYLLTSLAMKLGHSEAHLRLVSALASLGLVWLTYRMARLAADRQVATLAAAITALNPYQVMYAQEARTYTLVALFTTWSCYLFARAALLGRSRSWLPYVVVTTLGLYTQSIALLGIAAQGVMVLVSRASRLRVLPWVLAVGASILLYVPWLLVSLSQAAHISSSHWYISPPSPKTIFQVLRAVFLSPIPLVTPPPGASLPGLEAFMPRVLAQVLLIAAPAVPLLACLPRLDDPEDRGRIARFVFISFGTPLTLVFLASFRTPLWIPRYFVLSTPMLSVLLALGISSLKPRALSVAWSVLLIVVSGYGTFRYFTDYTKEPWREMAAMIATASDPATSTVLVPFDADPFLFYNEKLDRPFRVIAYAHPDVPFNDRWSPEQLGQMFRATQDSTRAAGDVWVVVRSPNSEIRRRVVDMANTAVSPGRRLVLEDSLESVGGPLRFTRWRDQPEGRLSREGDVAGAGAEQATGPAPAPITRPFTRAELAANADSVAYFVRKLRDRSFVRSYEHDGEQRLWYEAAEKLGQIGAPAVPALIARLETPDDFERMQVVYALLLATQDPRVTERTAGKYVNPVTILDGSDSRRDARIAKEWWKKHGHFWTGTAPTRGVSATAPAAAYDTLRVAPRNDR